MDSKLVYIGGRSRLLKRLNGSIPKGRVISLNESYELLNSNYFENKVVVLFSLPNSNIHDLRKYLQFINTVNCLRLINISSTCIYAYHDYKPISLPFYLRLKYYSHEAVSRKENSFNIVVGLVDICLNFLSTPSTSIEMLSTRIRESVNAQYHQTSKCVYAFIIKPAKYSSPLFNFFVSLRISCQRFKLAYLIFDLLCKLFAVNYRSYTLLSSLKFSSQLRVGDGAFGSASAAFGSSETVIYSDVSIHSLPQDVLGSFVGSSKIGLDKIRHGVSIVSHKNKLYKKWGFSLRFRRPFRYIKLNAQIVDLDWMPSSNMFQLIDDRGRAFFCSKLNLASGCINNCKLVLLMVKHNAGNISPSLLSTTVSDHFLSPLGLVDKNELISKEYLSPVLPFIPIYKRGHLLTTSLKSSYQGIVEFRLNKPKSNFAYRLVSSLQSYIFNRFGIVIFPPTKFFAFAQILVPCSLSLSLLPDLTFQVNSPPQISEILDGSISHFHSILLEKFSSFTKTKQCILPAHHTHGGVNLLSFKIVEKLILEDKLSISGSPSAYPLGPFHHTVELCKSLKTKKSPNHWFLG